jgi:hypothetical protein
VDGLVGYWRVVAGRRWLTDIIWSAVIVLAVTVLPHLTVRWRADPTLEPRAVDPVG